MSKLKEDSPDCMMTILGARRPSKRGSVSGRGKRFLPPSRLALVLTQSPTLRVLQLLLAE